MERFHSFVNSLNDVVGRMFSFLIFFAAIVILVEVTMRYGFNNPTLWGLVLTTLICGVVYLMGGPYAARRGTHVKIDILYSLWSPRVRAIADLFTALFLFLSLGCMLYIGIDFTYVAVTENVKISPYTWQPIAWPIRIFIPISIFLILMQAVSKFIRDIRTVRTGIAEAEEEAAEEGQESNIAVPVS